MPHLYSSGSTTSPSLPHILSQVPMTRPGLTGPPSNRAPAARRQRRRHTRRRNKSTPHPHTCPFNQSPAHLYSKCINNTAFPTLDNLRDHLVRSHSIPIHCPICYDQFSCRGDWHQHIKSQVCSEQCPPPGLLNGLDEDQVRKLRLLIIDDDKNNNSSNSKSSKNNGNNSNNKNNGDRVTTIWERPRSKTRLSSSRRSAVDSERRLDRDKDKTWCVIWDICFPGMSRPKSTQRA